jgi:hypothetical protein
MYDIQKMTGANLYEPFQYDILPYKQVNHKVLW